MALGKLVCPAFGMGYLNVEMSMAVLVSVPRPVSPPNLDVHNAFGASIRL